MFLLNIQILLLLISFECDFSEFSSRKPADVKTEKGYTHFIFLINPPKPSSSFMVSASGSMIGVRIFSFQTCWVTVCDIRWGGMRKRHCKHWNIRRPPAAWAFARPGLMAALWT